MPTFDLFETISITFLIQTILYLSFLITNPIKKANWILIIFLSVLVFVIFNLFLRFHWSEDVPYFYYEAVALLGPLLYLYVVAIVHQEFKFQTRQLYHITGLLLVILFRVLDIFISREDTFWAIDQMIAPFLFISTYSYLIQAIRRINRFHHIVLNTQSDFDTHSLKWLKYEIVILGIYFITLGAESLQLFLDLGNLYQPIVVSSFFSMLLFINILIFKSLKAPFITKGISIEQQKVIDAKRTRYQNSSLTVEESKKLYDQLITILTENKYYKQFDLSLSHLAQITQLPSASLSQVINENAQMNFNDFINQYRVAEAKRLLSENPKSLIKEVMYDSGFQSTSTFNSSFKKITGMSPSAYRKQAKQS